MTAVVASAAAGRGCADSFLGSTVRASRIWKKIVFTDGRVRWEMKWNRSRYATIVARVTEHRVTNARGLR